MSSQKKGAPAPKESRPDPAEYQRWLNIRVSVRCLVIVYLGWLLYDLIQRYLAGTAGVGLPVVVATILGFVLAAVFLGLATYRQWRRGREELARLWAEQDQADGPDEDAP